MKTETISESATLLIRRLILQPGEATSWHVDACRRFSVVIRGSRLDIEYRDGGRSEEVSVHPGLAGWDEPQPRVHRAVNRGTGCYEEVVTFHRDAADIEPQPEPDQERTG